MRDATDLMMTYRECVRQLWNGFLRAQVEPFVDFDALDRFSELSAVLFGELVLRPLDARSVTRRTGSPWSCFVLQPTIDPLPLMVERAGAAGHYWDDPITALEVLTSRLLFVDFFDWDRFGYIDLQYYRARIFSSERHPHLAGRDALIDVHHAKVLFSADE